MNFKRKAGAAILAVAAASAIAVPGVAVAAVPVATTTALATVSTFTGYLDAGTTHAAYYKGSLVGNFTDGEGHEQLVTATDESDDIEGFLSASKTAGNEIKELTSLVINNNEIDSIDLTNATNARVLNISGSDFTDIDGLDKVGTGITTVSADTTTANATLAAANDALAAANDFVTAQGAVENAQGIVDAAEETFEDATETAETAQSALTAAQGNVVAAGTVDVTFAAASLDLSELDDAAEAAVANIATAQAAVNAATEGSVDAGLANAALDAANAASTLLGAIADLDAAEDVLNAADEDFDTAEDALADATEALDDATSPVTSTFAAASLDLSELDDAAEAAVANIATAQAAVDAASLAATLVNSDVVVTIVANDLTNVDFGDNDAKLDITLDTELETLDMSSLDNMTSLDVSACGDLESLDVSDDEDLLYLDITGTKLATLDTSDTAITATKGELKSDVIDLDSQYAYETVNDDDDDYNDYTINMDDVTGGYAERIMSDDDEDSGTMVDKDANGTSFIVTFASGETIKKDYLDFDDGDLVITAEKAPLSVQFINMTDKDDNAEVIYSAAFDIKTSGTRIAGSDRYDTMHELNTTEGDDNFDDIFDTKDVVVASGAGYADALSASSLAGALNTGIVTTAVDSMTDDTIDMLEDMDDQGTAYIVGGTSAISYAVEQQLTDLGFKIQRMAGTDRFETAVKTQDEIQDLIDEDNSEVVDGYTVIIASGVSYADALAIAPYAYNKNAPIVLVGADGTMDDATAALFNKYKKDYKHAVVVGGTSVVSDDVIDTLQGYDMDVIRLAGSDRYETNLVINDWLDRGNSDISSSDEIFAAAGYSKNDISDFNDEDMNAGTGNSYTDKTAYVVTGTGYADALAVAPLAGIYGGTINMVSDTNLTTVTEAVDNDANTKVVGGTSAISSDVFDAIEDLD